MLCSGGSSEGHTWWTLVAGGGLDEDPTEECRPETGAEAGRHGEGPMWRRIGAVEVPAWTRAGLEARAEQGRRGGGCGVDEGWHSGGPAWRRTGAVEALARTRAGVEAGTEQGPRCGGLGVEDGRRAWAVAVRRSGCRKVLVGRMTRGQWRSGGAGRTEFDLGHNPFRRGREEPIYKIPLVTGNIEACYQWVVIGNGHLSLPVTIE